MATLLEQVAGFIGGGPGRVDAAGAAALLASKAEGLRDDILAKAKAFGAKLGPTYGSDLFGALFEGAQKPAAEAVAARERELFGFDRQTVFIFAGVAGLGLVIGLMTLGRRR